MRLARRQPREAEEARLSIFGSTAFSPANGCSSNYLVRIIM